MWDTLLSSACNWPRWSIFFVLLCRVIIVTSPLACSSGSINSIRNSSSTNCRPLIAHAARTTPVPWKGFRLFQQVLDRTLGRNHTRTVEETFALPSLCPRFVSALILLCVCVASALPLLCLRFAFALPLLYVSRPRCPAFHCCCSHLSRFLQPPWRVRPACRNCCPHHFHLFSVPPQRLRRTCLLLKANNYPI